MGNSNDPLNVCDEQSGVVPRRKVIDPAHGTHLLQPKRSRPVGCSARLAVCMFPQFVFNVAGRKYLDARQATEIVDVNVGPVWRLNLNRLSMSDADDVCLHDIQLMRRLQIDVTSCVVEGNSGNSRYINLVGEWCSSCKPQ